ncbi:4'-phosphopantetheinyl transferase family protein [Methylobacterium gnaphalii]|nr:4'-phosphopantetheinyl transferase superfamily protein [Methylobacterium gnaphalii]GJD70438.1 hypothetical protein MMMDOFMJ_3386 [Methylobacterium gnaphalii]
MTVTSWPIAEPGPLREPTVWRIDLTLDEIWRHACLAALSEDERARAARFLRLEDRDRYAASHAALRHILAGALGTDPGLLRFRSGAAGKPELDGPWRDRLAFNLSHSGRIGLIGLSPAGRIGVDVELTRPLSDCLGLARSHFSRAEIAALEAQPPADRQAAFYACWTRKEAFVKALGAGLSFPLNRFVVAVPPEPAALVSLDGSAQAARGWSLQHLDPAPDHVGAVAIQGEGPACLLRSLDADWSTNLA